MSNKLVVYQRQPRFVFSRGSASAICKYNPYAILGIVDEDVDSLIALLGCAERDPVAKQVLQMRQMEIRAAYLELAARYHPDSDKLGTSLYTWINVYDHFAAISTSYKILYDVMHAVEYCVASMNPEGTAHMDEFGASEKYERLVRKLRHQKALIERKSMAAHIEACLEEQKLRQMEHGDGLFVRHAVYGDARAITNMLPTISSGQEVNMPAILAKYTNVIDVTGVLQGLVEITDRDAATEAAVVQLHLSAGTKTALEGVWDPCDGNAKKLWLRYEFLGKLHEAVIDDEMPLKCPVKKHMVKALISGPKKVLSPSSSNTNSGSQDTHRALLKKHTVSIHFQGSNENESFATVSLDADDPANENDNLISPSKRNGRKNRFINFSTRSPITSPVRKEPEMQETFTKVVDPRTGNVEIIKTKTPRKAVSHAITPAIRMARPRGRAPKEPNPIHITVNVQLPPVAAQEPGPDVPFDAARLLAKLKALEMEEYAAKQESIWSRVWSTLTSRPVLTTGCLLLVSAGSYAAFSAFRPAQKPQVDVTVDKKLAV